MGHPPETRADPACGGRPTIILRRQCLSDARDRQRLERALNPVIADGLASRQPSEHMSHHVAGCVAVVPLPGSGRQCFCTLAQGAVRAVRG